MCISYIQIKYSPTVVLESLKINNLKIYKRYENIEYFSGNQLKYTNGTKKQDNISLNPVIHDYLFH
jgi:hypothetical protein